MYPSKAMACAYSLVCVGLISDLVHVASSGTDQEHKRLALQEPWSRVGEGFPAHGAELDCVFCQRSK